MGTFGLSHNTGDLAGAANVEAVFYPVRTYVKTDVVT